MSLAKIVKGEKTLEKGVCVAAVTESNAYQIKRSVKQERGLTNTPKSRSRSLVAALFKNHRRIEW